MKNASFVPSTQPIAASRITMPEREKTPFHQQDLHGINDVAPVTEFNFDGFEVRTIMISGEPWFVAKDVCAVLELSNPTMAIESLDYNERAKFNLGRQGKANVISESGLYSLIFKSRKQEAKRFQKWVTAEVVPTIRKTGGAYLTAEKTEEVVSNPETLIKVAQQVIELRKANEEQRQKIEHDMPKVLFADAVAASEDSILVGELAKILKQRGVDTGANRLFGMLRDKGYLGKRKGREWNRPTQRSMELGLFEIVERCINMPSEPPRITMTPKVTGKGQIYFINKFSQGKQCREDIIE